MCRLCACTVDVTWAINTFLELLGDVYITDGPQLSGMSGMTHGGDCTEEKERVVEENKLTKSEH